MNVKKSLLIASIAGLFSASLPMVSLSAGPAGKQGGGGGQIAVSTQLDYQETEDLTFMREEEKLARDVYITLHKRWKRPIFSNISSAEQKHMDRLAEMLDRYMLPDPVANDAVGMFTDGFLGGLYSELIDEGWVSLLAALKVGAKIEEIDILDLQDAIEHAKHQDLVNVYENLMRGSRNHLRAFVRQIENQGVAYEAQAMEQDDVDAILAEPMERGGKTGKGGRGK